MGITIELLRSKGIYNAEDCEYLDLSRHGIGQIENLNDFINLRALNLSFNNICFVTNVQHCSNLWHINLANNSVENLTGFEAFLALGKLDLSCNDVGWDQLMHLKHLAVIDLILAGNQQLTTTNCYRIHVVDSLPHVWMLDGRLVTYTERLHVERFFETSELSLHPVRHKLPRAKFQTSEMRQRMVNGTFGRKTRDLMLQFPVHMSANSETDDRRLTYLAENLEEDLLLMSNYQTQSFCVLNNNPYFIQHLLRMLDSDPLTFHTISLLLMASLHFTMSELLLKDFTTRCTLDCLADIAVSEIFQLPCYSRQSLASVLLSAVKLHRDNRRQDDGLHDMLFLAFYFGISELCTKIKSTRLSRTVQIVMRLIAIETVQLLTICPAFYTAIGKHRGLTALLTAATCETMTLTIAEMFQDELTMPAIDRQSRCVEAAALVNSELTQRAHDYYYCHSPVDSQQLYVLMTQDAFPKKPVHWPLFASKFHTRGLSSPAAKQQQNKSNPPTRKPNLGERILLGAQLTGCIIAIPEPGIVLVQTMRVVTHSGAVIVNYKQLDEHYSYHDITEFLWDCHRKLWRPVGTTGDSITFKATKAKELQTARHETVSTHDRLRPLPDRCTTSQPDTATASIAGRFLATHDLRLSFEVQDAENWLSWPHEIRPIRPYYDFRQLLHKRKPPECRVPSINESFDMPHDENREEHAPDFGAEGSIPDQPGHIAHFLPGPGEPVSDQQVPGPPAPGQSASESATQLLDVMPNIAALMADNNAAQKQKQRLTFLLPSPFGDVDRVGVVQQETGDVYFMQRHKSRCANVSSTGEEVACTQQLKSRFQSATFRPRARPHELKSASAGLRHAPTVGILTTANQFP